ncbi:MAG: hypothetical protein KIT73_06590, partial [Burkholderiales bacterium]|nr:hypothetical protein [Burkholderiales bacterium]
MLVTRFSVSAGALLLLAVSHSASSATLAQHTGSVDPISQGWQYSSDAASLFTGGSESIAGTTYEFWETQDLSTESFNAYVIPLSDSLRENAWSLVAVVRVVSSPLVNDFTVGGQSVTVSDGITVWQFNFSDANAGPVTPFPFSYIGDAEVGDTTDVYHEYRIDFLPNQAGTQDDTANFYVDGNLVFAGVERDSLAATSGPSQILFGNASSPGLSTARYSS